jgi:copper chaperone CopZ
MKKTIILVTLFLCTIQSFAQFQSASLTASGLTCSMCSKSIFKALEKLPAVHSIDVDLDKSVFTIQFKENSSIKPDEIKSAVVDAGFAVAALQMNAIFPDTRLSKDAHISFDGAIYHFLNGDQKALSGKVSFQVVDKNFVPINEFRKYKKMTSMACIETGKAQSCCAKDLAVGARIYHVIL